MKKPQRIDGNPLRRDVETAQPRIGPGLCSFRADYSVMVWVMVAMTRRLACRPALVSFDSRGRE